MSFRILIADAEPLSRLSLNEALTRLGYHVVGEAADGMSALALARAEHPHLVIMDVGRSGMDNLSAAATLSREQVAPVMLLTTSGDPDLLARARHAGVIQYVVKPWRQSDLQPAIEIGLARFSALQTMQQQVRELQEQLAARKQIERAKGVVMQLLKLSEQKAFTWMQQQSRKTQKPMREIAESILLTAERESGLL